MPFVSRAEVITVSIHATSGWVLVISLHQSTALPTQLRRQGGKAGETDSFPSLSLSLSPPFFLPICVSHSHSDSNSPFVKAVFHHCALMQPVTFSLRSLVLRPSVCSSPVGVRQVSLIFVCVFPSLPSCLSSVCMQTRPQR